MKIYQKLSSLLNARQNCRNSNNREWEIKHDEEIKKIVDNYLPSGSGWDVGTSLVESESSDEKIVLSGGFHHMDENGGYDGWTDHKITVKPSLQFGFVLHISGKDRNQIKEYLHDIFDNSLNGEYDEIKKGGK